MYETIYVRKKKRRILVAIITGISSAVVTSLGIISFLGRTVGSFTVKLETGKVMLTLSEEKSFKTQSSYLRISELPGFHETTFTSIIERGEDALDSESTDYMYGANYGRDGRTVTSLDFFKYTFYVKNVGLEAATYDISLNLIYSKAADDGRILEDTVRVMLYDNDDENTHNRMVYAKRSATHHIDEEGNAKFNEAISIPKEEETSLDAFQGYAELFESSTVVTRRRVEDFQVGQIKRYTVVYWLEGYDPQSSNFDLPPENAKIKLGVEINAYEN